MTVISTIPESQVGPEMQSPGSGCVKLPRRAGQARARQQPEADFLNCKSGPEWRPGGERQPSMGTPERSMPSDAVAVARTSHWRHAAFGIPCAPETNEHRHEQSPVAVRMPTQPSRSSQTC